jgi:hypothetical protein
MSEDLQDKITQIQIHYADMLMEKAHVLGCGVGFAMVAGQLTDELALIVMVDVKLPEDELNPDDIVPRFLDDVRCDVQETGTILSF